MKKIKGRKRTLTVRDMLDSSRRNKRAKLNWMERDLRKKLPDPVKRLEYMKTMINILGG